MTTIAKRKSPLRFDKHSLLESLKAPETSVIKPLQACEGFFCGIV